MGVESGYIGAAWLNLLELGAVTISSAAADYPAYRLFDRYFKRMWRAASTADQSVVVDMGASLVSFDTLVIPSAHNLAFNGTVRWESSVDGVTYTDLVPGWSQTDNGLIFKQIVSPISQRFVRVRFTGASVPVEVPEIFVTQLHQFLQPWQGSSWGVQRNVARNEPKSRVVQFVDRGSPQRYRDYSMQHIPSAFMSLFQQWDDGFCGSKPFFFVDHRGEKFFAELLGAGDGRFIAFEEGEYGGSASLKILEVLG